MKNIRQIIKEALEKEVNKTLVLKEKTEISEALQYHIENNLSLTDNVFRVYSKGYFDLVNEVRNLWSQGKIHLNEEDTMMVESNLGERIKIGEEIVYLDAPFEIDEDEVLEEAKHRGKNVKLGKPFRTPGGPKKFAVYVKTPKGTIKKVTFGDPNMRIRNTSKARAKSFTARHNCKQKKDRTTAGYWSCNVSRYRKKLGLKSSRSW